MIGLKNIAALTLIALVALFGAAGEALAQAQTVSVVIVRHPEAKGPLTPAGIARAELLIHTLRGVKFTHVFSSHTMRSRQAVEKIAAAHGVPVVQLPAPGSMLDGKPVIDQTTSRAAIDPVSEALLKLPAGSVALVGLNSDNIYAILNRLGVPVAPEGRGCAQGSMCVPCTSNKCYPGKEFDHLWHVVRQPGRAEPIAYIELRYGAGWPGPKS